MILNELQGLWRRDWLRSDFTTDNTTCVFWAQAGKFFVDLRIPLHRPCISPYNCLAELDAHSLYQLLQSEGFAGHIDLVGDVCTWNRAINWHGQSDTVDAGKLWFSEPAKVLMEDGVHANYQEQWQCVPRHTFDYLKITTGGMSGLLLISNSLFILGVGNPHAMSSASLFHSLSKGIIPTTVHEHFSSYYCVGQWDGETGIAELSTNPFCENKTALVKENGSFSWVQYAFDGTEKLHLV